MPVRIASTRGSATIEESCPPRSITLPAGRKMGSSSAVIIAARGMLSQHPKKQVEGRRMGLESTAIEEDAEGPAMRRESERS